MSGVFFLSMLIKNGCPCRIWSDLIPFGHKFGSCYFPGRTQRGGIWEILPRAPMIAGVHWKSKYPWHLWNINEFLKTFFQKKWSIILKVNYEIETTTIYLPQISYKLWAAPVVCGPFLANFGLILLALNGHDYFRPKFGQPWSHLHTLNLESSTIFVKLGNLSVRLQE